MTGVLSAALALFRRDHRLLLAVAAPWLFLPAFALALLVPPPPRYAATDAESGRAWAEALVAWAGDHGGWYALAQLVGMAGVATLYALYLAGRPTVGQAIGRGVRALPRLVLAMLLSAPAILIGLSLWLVPGLWIMARLVLVSPTLVAERRGVLGAIGASVRRTRGQDIPLTAAVALPFLGGWLASQPLLSLDAWLREATRINPVALAMVDAGAAAVALAAALAQALIAIAAYRTLAR
jgi:hypothetical protein